MQTKTRHLPTIEELQNDIILYSRTSKQYETAPSDTPLPAHAEFLNRMPLHGTVSAAFSYYYELKACDAYLLLYTKSGQGRYASGDTALSLLPGTVLFLHCTADYILELAESGGWQYHFLYISGSMAASYYDAYMQADSPLYTLPVISGIPYYIERIFYLYSIRTAEKHYDFLLSNLLSGLLTSLLTEKENSRSDSSQLPPLLAKVKKRFDQDYMQPFSLDELAHAEHISKYKLVRDFTAHLGISPINYLISVRIENAKRLLISTCDPINEIAAAVGIDNMNHFIYLFKKSEGMTPGAYRKACYTQKRHLIQ